MEYYHQVLDRAVAATQTNRRLQAARRTRTPARVAVECGAPITDDCCPFFPC
jgi:hypothetical protein